MTKHPPPIIKNNSVGSNTVQVSEIATHNVWLLKSPPSPRLSPKIHERYRNLHTISFLLENNMELCIFCRQNGQIVLGMEWGVAVFEYRVYAAVLLWLSCVLLSKPNNKINYLITFYDIIFMIFYSMLLMMFICCLFKLIL